MATVQSGGNAAIGEGTQQETKPNIFKGKENARTGVVLWSK